MELHKPSFEAGVLLGVLAGCGSIGGDARRPHITLKMHVRHERLILWLLDRWPFGRLYGPYTHGGRRYFQLMFRGRGLTERLMPVLESVPWADLDDVSHARYLAMKRRYDLPGASVNGE